MEIIKLSSVSSYITFSQSVWTQTQRKTVDNWHHRMFTTLESFGVKWIDIWLLFRQRIDLSTTTPDLLCILHKLYYGRYILCNLFVIDNDFCMYDPWKYCSNKLNRDMRCDWVSIDLRHHSTPLFLSLTVPVFLQIQPSPPCGPGERKSILKMTSFVKG